MKANALSSRKSTALLQIFQQTATILCELGFDGIDINMGCSAKNVENAGAGAALIETPDLAQAIIRLPRWNC